MEEITAAKEKTKNLNDLFNQFLHLSCRERFNRICRILDFYIAGETKNKQLLFFLVLGNYSEEHKTLVLYRGDSSAGKSYVVDKILYLFPKEDGYVFTSATSKALNYDSDLVGKKWIFLKEMTEANKDQITEFLKSLFDEGERVHKETVKDNQAGGHRTITHTHEERYGVITTFSFENIQVDLVNRGWVLTPDQKHEQTKNIVDFTIKNKANKIDRKVKERQILNQCYVIAQSIKLLNWDFDIYIPYIELLKGMFPYEHLNVRRDVNKLSHLIEIVALWNQHHRKTIKIGETKYLFAEYEDLELALEIAHDLFIDLVLHVDESKRLILDFFPQATRKSKIKQKNIVQIISDAEDIEEENVIDEDITDKLTITDIYEGLRDKLGINRRTVQRRMDDLYAEGYLQRDKIKGKWYYSKVKDYNIIKALELEKLKPVIDKMVDEKYNHYNNIDEEDLEGFI